MVVTNPLATRKLDSSRLPTRAIVANPNNHTTTPICVYLAFFICFHFLSLILCYLEYNTCAIASLMFDSFGVPPWCLVCYSAGALTYPARPNDSSIFSRSHWSLHYFTLLLFLSSISFNTLVSYSASVSSIRLTLSQSVSFISQ